MVRVVFYAPDQDELLDELELSPADILDDKVGAYLSVKEISCRLRMLLYAMKANKKFLEEAWTWEEFELSNCVLNISRSALETVLDEMLLSPRLPFCRLEEFCAYETATLLVNIIEPYPTDDGQCHEGKGVSHVFVIKRLNVPKEGTNEIREHFFIGHLLDAIALF